MPAKFTRLIRQAVTLLLSGAVLAGAVTGCSSAAASGKTLTVAFRSDNSALVSLDPIQVYWIEHRSVLRNVVESLTDQDPQTKEVKPWLAESWTISKDQRTYTFKLKQGITFSNGEKFDAQAVKTSFESNLAAITKDPAVFGYTYLAGFTSATVVDDHTVALTLKKANGSFLQALSTVTLGILAPASYAADVADRNLAKKLYGTGPFTIASYTPQSGISLVKRNDYVATNPLAANQGPALVDRIEVKYIPEDSVRVGALQSGEVDLAAPRVPFSPSDTKQLTQAGIAFTSYSLPGTIEGYSPNVTTGPLVDVNVRRAVQAAVDRTTYASTVFGEKYPVANGVYDSSTQYYKDESAALAFNQSTAKKLLDKAGWVPGADGYRVKDGKTLELVYPVTAESTGDLLVQDQLKQVGIKLTLKVLTTGDQAAAVDKGQWNFARGVFTRGDPSIIASILDTRTSTDARAKLSVPAAIQTTLQGYLDQGLATTDSAKRKAAYAAVQDLLVDQALVIPVFERVQQVGLQSKVKGLAFTGEGFLDFRSVSLG